MNDELKVNRLSRAARPYTFRLSYALAASALLLSAATNAAARRPRKRPTPLPSPTARAATPTPSPPAADPVNPDPRLTALHRLKLLFPAASSVVGPLLYVSLGAGVALLLLSLAVPLGSLWYAVARSLAAAGLLAVVGSILLALYMLFFISARTRELTRIRIPGSAAVNLPSTRDYVLLKTGSDLPQDLRVEVRPQSGAGGPEVRAGEHGWSYLHTNYRQIGGFSIESPGVYEVSAVTSEKKVTAAAVLVGPDYSDEFAAGKWMALVALVAGLGLRLSARGVASVTSTKRHRERLAQGFRLFHEQKGLSPHRFSRARLKVYDRALVLTRKFSESEIGRAEVVAVEKAQKTVKSSKAGFPNTHLEGVLVHYQGGGAHRSAAFWTDSYRKQDEGRTDRLLREKLREAGYPVRW